MIAFQALDNKKDDKKTNVCLFSFPIQVVLELELELQSGIERSHSIVLVLIVDFAVRLSEDSFLFIYTAVQPPPHSGAARL